MVEPWWPRGLCWDHTPGCCPGKQPPAIRVMWPSASKTALNAEILILLLLLFSICFKMERPFLARHKTQTWGERRGRCWLGAPGGRVSRLPLDVTSCTRCLRPPPRGRQPKAVSTAPQGQPVPPLMHLKFSLTSLLAAPTHLWVSCLLVISTQASRASLKFATLVKLLLIPPGRTDALLRCT